MQPHTEPAVVQSPARPPCLGAGPVLVLAPRALDALAGSGGTLALHAALGDPVDLVEVFGPADTRVHAAASALGVKRIESWDLPELGTGTGSDLARRLARLLLERRPATLYAPWSGEPDAQARALSQAAALAAALADFEGPAWGYELRAALPPSRTLDVGATWAAKRAVLERCAGHLAPAGLARALEGLAAFRGLELQPVAEFAEAFAPLADLRIPVPRGAAHAAAHATAQRA